MTTNEIAIIRKIIIRIVAGNSSMVGTGKGSKLLVGVDVGFWVGDVF